MPKNKQMDTTIVSYDQRFDEDIQMLEQYIVQGNNIQLEIIKDHFLDRATVFKKYYASLALDQAGIPIATAIGARTSLCINGTSFDAGIGYEVKVHPRYHNKGIGRKMATHIYQHFFRPEGLGKNFITLKKSNIPVVRLVARAIGKIWLYNFVYLTIPATTRTGNILMGKSKKQLFSVGLFNKEELHHSYYTDVSNNLGYFHTYKMYRLKIRRIGFLYKLGLVLIKKLQPKKYASLPKVKETFHSAALYNHHAGNIHNINEVLEQLENKEIHYLMVCCQKNDCIYDALKKFSINTYGYYILGDFPLTKKDKVTIDARCL